MPVSFVPAEVFDWPPIRPAVQAPAPTPAGKKGAKKVVSKKAGKKDKKQARIPAQTLTILIDRIEDAIARDRIALCDEEMPADYLDFTVNELALLLELIFPEEFWAPTAAPAPTLTAPASAERIAVYARRRAARQKLYAKGDAGAVHPSGAQLKLVERRNGTGRRVAGWTDEDDDLGDDE